MATTLFCSPEERRKKTKKQQQEGPKPNPKRMQKTQQKRGKIIYGVFAFSLWLFRGSCAWLRPSTFLLRHSFEAPCARFTFCFAKSLCCCLFNPPAPHVWWSVLMALQIMLMMRIRVVQQYSQALLFYCIVVCGAIFRSRQLASLRLAEAVIVSSVLLFVQSLMLQICRST